MPVHGDELSAQWIWKKRQSYLEYNDAIIARKTFQLPRVQRARILITADTRYRLFINDEWVKAGRLTITTTSLISVHGYGRGRIRFVL